MSKTIKAAMVRCWVALGRATRLRDNLRGRATLGSLCRGHGWQESRSLGFKRRAFESFGEISGWRDAKHAWNRPLTAPYLTEKQGGVVMFALTHMHPNEQNANSRLFLRFSDDLFTDELHTLSLDTQADRLSVVILQAAYLSIPAN